MKAIRMSNWVHVAAMTTVMTVSSGCMQRKMASGKMREISYDPSARNIALLFGAANGLPGIPEDLESMKAVLEDPAGGNGFKVVLINEATTKQILDATRQAAVDAGENGTIFWYFSGHGAESGSLMTIGGMLPFSKVTDVVREARQTPVKRFYAMFDSCFSGQMVDGSAAINNRVNTRPGSDSGNDSEYALVAATSRYAEADYLKVTAQTYADIAAETFYDRSPVATMESQPFEQLIVISASQRYETSLAGSNGSQFTNALKAVFKRMKSNSPNATIGQFIDAIKSETRSETGGHHTPAARVMPEQGVLDDSLFVKPNRQRTPDSQLQPQGTEPAPQNAAPAIAIALGAMDQASGSTRIYANVDGAAGRVGLCSGRREACVRTGTVFLEFREPATQEVFPQVTGRKVFESAKPLRIAAAKPVTFLVYDATGKIIASRTIQFRPK